MKTQVKTFPHYPPHLMKIKEVKNKYITLEMSETDLGVDWRGDVYRIVNGIATKLK